MDDLVRALKAGDAGAFGRLVRDHGDRLYRFVRRMVGDRPAEDVTQEVFLRLHRSIGKYEPTGSFSAWVYTLASHVCIDFLRRPKPTGRPIPPAQAADGPDPGESASAQELREAILHAVERLPLEQKQVFLLREEAGFTFREIAQMLGCPLNTALGRMHYAMQNLRKLLASYRE